ncbi:MAG: type II toxin-antitoxin system RelE/ParE family toxin [Nitrospiraceae bacterium]|nr:type II toxin-antitoxin system RelE/ParE family toxin [Nitrospiraceae bacterium]
MHCHGFSAVCGAILEAIGPGATGVEEYPSLGRVVPEFELSNFRELIHGAYGIIYEIRQDTCYVEAVIHSSRDLMMHYKPGQWDVTG